jgi:hypothetical protein
MIRTACFIIRIVWTGIFCDSEFLQQNYKGYSILWYENILIGSLLLHQEVEDVEDDVEWNGKGDGEGYEAEEFNVWDDVINWQLWQLKTSNRWISGKQINR